MTVMLDVKMLILLEKRLTIISNRERRRNDFILWK